MFASVQIFLQAQERCPSPPSTTPTCSLYIQHHNGIFVHDRPHTPSVHSLDFLPNARSTAPTIRYTSHVVRLRPSALQYRLYLHR